MIILGIENLQRSTARGDLAGGNENCFECKHIHSMHSIFACCLLFGSSAEAIEALNDGYGLQPVMGQGGNELCLRQSAGNSTDPEIDVAPYVL